MNESETLRRAASLMRERAEAATPGPWEVVWNAVAYVATVSDPSDPTGQTPMQEPVKVADAGERDREHIASWHPAVALAVADWLDDVATNLEAADDEVLFDPDSYPIKFEDTTDGHALTVTRAYLGEAS